MPLVAAPGAVDSRLYLSGDENCGVSLYCRDCWDGGRPLAYYDSNDVNAPYKNDELVENVTTISALWTVMRRHAREVHG
jgi:hypothetical protein